MPPSPRLWSSYVGRNPTLKRAELEVTLPVIDAARDREPWLPVGAAGETRKATPSFLSSTFHWQCRLAITQEKILSTVCVPLSARRRGPCGPPADSFSLSLAATPYVSPSTRRRCRTESPRSSASCRALSPTVDCR